MAQLTPMMAQYKQIKDQYKDCILMFRLGDFYEMFFEDATTASEILQITLTSRNKEGSVKVPMCGIPYHAVDNYLAKLTRAGKKVAICDQMTEPDGKSIVQREVIRIVTPGTTFDENIIDSKANNYIACVVERAGSYGFSYADVTTGDFWATEFENIKEIESEFLRIKPSEVIADKILLENFRNKNLCAFPYEYNKDAESLLKEYFGVQSLGVFGLKQDSSAVLSSGMLFEYLKETQKTELKHIKKIIHYSLSEFMVLDEACIKNLELFFTAYDGKKEGSLVWAIDHTVTPMGGRLIRNWLLHPLLSKSSIENRLDKVNVFFNDSSLLRNAREILSNIRDIERLISRLGLGIGNARDIVALKESLKIIPDIKNLINGISILQNINDELFVFSDLISVVENAIVDEAPLSVRDGGIIKSGFNAELDALRSISTEGKTFIKELQEREIKRTGISSLKVKFNTVFGYYIEISKSNLSSVPFDYIRKQTLVNAERFITPELKEYEEKVLNAEGKIKEMEYEIFYKVRMEAVKEIARIQSTAKAIAYLDTVSTFAFNSVKNNYCKPEISEDLEIKILNGRHPVIELIGVHSKSSFTSISTPAPRLGLSKDFVPNDCELNEQKTFLLITGPNMGGKSTYLRQVALISLMAQIGSYVPAENAKMSVVDRIFTRVGAADNLVKGESTFMVEMQETSYILNHATEKSLIILDEIGRGTSTYDGVSIAWAVMEFIHDNIKAKTLFATHYHELINLGEKLDRACNLSVAVRENENEGVVFLYKITDGGIDKSYGIEVAKLAGLPVDIISRARGVLKELETKNGQKRTLQKPGISPEQLKICQ